MRPKCADKCANDAHVSPGSAVDGLSITAVDSVHVHVEENIKFPVKT